MNTMPVKTVRVIAVHVLLVCTELLKCGQTMGALSSQPKWKKTTEISVPLLEENDVYNYTMSLIRQLGWTQVVLLSNQERTMETAVIQLDGLTVQQHVMSCSSPDSPGSALEVDAALLDMLLVQLRDPNIVIFGTECLQLQVVNWMKQDLPTKAGHMSPLLQDSRWLLVLNSHVIERLDMTSLPVNHVAVLQHDLVRHRGSLKTLIWTASGRHLDAVRVKQGSRVQPSIVYPNFQYGFNGMSLHVGINIWTPYIMEGRQNERAETEYRGFSMDLLVILSAALNFTYTVAIPEDGEWGDYRDGRWTGIVGQIDRQEVDFSVAPMTPKLERRSVVDWTSPMNIRYTGIGVRITSYNGLLAMALLRPFQWHVYTAVLAAFVFVTSAISISITLESNLRKERQRKDPSVFIIIEFLFGSFVKEIVPSSLLNRDGARRPLIAAWSTFGLLVTTCYTSKLTSLLVDVTPPTPFNSLQEMVTSGEYRWGMIGGTAILNSFRYSNNSVMKTAYRGLLDFVKDDPDILSLDAEVHRAKMASENYAFIGEEDLQDLWAAEDCSIQVIRERIVGMETYNVFTPKRSVVTQRIHTVLLKLEAGGVMDQLKARWWPKDTPCVSKDTSQTAVTLATMQGVFYLAAGGMVLAVGALLWERVAGKGAQCLQTARRKLRLPHFLGGRDG